MDRVPAWDLPYHAIRLFYEVVRPPRLKLRAVDVEAPSASSVSTIVYATYFLVTSGVIYDVLRNPGSMGSMIDPRTGVPKPTAFLQGRIHQQFIVEGLVMGFFFLMGAAGVVMLKLSADEQVAGKRQHIWTLVGFVAVVASLKVSEMCFGIKMPSYNRGFNA